MIEVQTISAPPVCRVRLLANRPLTRGQLKFCFLIIALGSLTFAGVFALMGLWVPLPFAGLELTLLWFCLDSVWRRNAESAESIEIGADRVAVASQRPSYRRQFSTGWLQVELRPDRRAWYPDRLLLKSHGQELEVGSFLTDEERDQAADAIREGLRRQKQPRRTDVGDRINVRKDQN